MSQGAVSPPLTPENLSHSGETKVKSQFHALPRASSTLSLSLAQLSHLGFLIYKINVIVMVTTDGLTWIDQLSHRMGWKDVLPPWFSLLRLPNLLISYESCWM